MGFVFLMEKDFDLLASECVEGFYSLSEEKRRTSIVVIGGSYFERFLFASSLSSRVDVGVSTAEDLSDYKDCYLVNVEEFLPKYSRVF